MCLYSKKKFGKKNISQTNIFSIFPASVPFQTITKILQTNVSTKYLQTRSLWINKLFIELANRNERICLSIACSGNNINGPGRFRTKAHNPEEQIYYFNNQNDDQLFNVFVSKRVNEINSTDGIYFQIERVRSKTNSETFDAKVELSSLLQNGSDNDITSTKYGDGFGPGYHRFGDGRNIKQTEKKQRRSVRPKFYSGR